MAQLIVLNLEDDILDKLRELARAHGRSLEQEVREILRSAIGGTGLRDAVCDRAWLSGLPCLALTGTSRSCVVRRPDR